MENTNTAIYGGAFNPPTLAHAQVVKEVLETSHISRVIISPSGEREDKNFGIRHKQRKKLVEIFFQILQDDGLNVSLEDHFFEGQNSGITTTRAEEEYFRAKLGLSPYFIFGSDVATNMHWWSNNKNRFIEEKLKKIFISRPGFEFDFDGNGFDEYMLLDIPDMLNVSSSAAREMIQNKQSVKDVLHPEIIKEVQKENLYQ